MSTAPHAAPSLRVSRPTAHIALLELHRPHAQNALDDALYAHLAAALDALNADAHVLAIILTGAAAHFSSGTDVRQVAAAMATPRNSAQDAGQMREMPMLPSQSPAKRFMDALLACRKLVIAAVNGAAVGIAVTMLLHCDMVYAREDAATFWTPFARLGMPPEFAASYLFPQVLGMEMTHALLFRGVKLDAIQARACGMVTRVVSGSREVFLTKVIREVNEMLQQDGAPIQPEEGRPDDYGEHILLTTKRLLRTFNAPFVQAAMTREFAELDCRAKNGQLHAAVTQFLTRFQARGQQQPKPSVSAGPSPSPSKL